MRLLARRYRTIAELGRGGMGVVWRAHDERLGRDVAVKVLHDWVADDAALRRRFEREAATLALLQHPHVVRLYDVAEEEGRTLLVMELVEGSTLAQTVGAGRSMSWDAARRVCAPVAEALAYAHERGVVHRDLSPANVLIERASGRVVVSDFGLARLARGTRSATASAILAGTPEYWAPEQAAGAESGPPADVYALGCILFRLLAGRPPFTGDDRLAVGLRRVQEDAPALADAAPSAPAEAGHLVRTLLRHEPAARPPAAAVAHDLDASAARPQPARTPWRAADGTGDATLPTRTAPVSHSVEPTLARRPRPYRALRRGRIVAAALGACAVAAGGGGGVYALASKEPPGIDAPRVVGTRPDSARAEVAAASERADMVPPRVRVVGRSYSERAPAGTIISQEPAPGEHLATGAVLTVRLSRGTPWAAVPRVVALPTADARARLAQTGFRAVRRYAPSVTVPAWHVAETRPGAGTRLRRPFTLTLVVSTGPPRVRIPDVRGDDADEAVAALERAGLAVAVREASSSGEPGRVLELAPPAGTRTRLGSTVEMVVARKPEWRTLRALDGDDDAVTAPLRVPRGGRVVLFADNTSFLSLFGGSVTAEWTGDAVGSVELVADGGGTVLVEPARADRVVTVRLDSDGSARWRLRVEALR